MPEEIELSSSIRRLGKYLPPPLVDLDYVVINEETGQVGFRWTKGGKVTYTWDWPNEKAAAKELGRIRATYPDKKLLDEIEDLKEEIDVLEDEVHAAERRAEKAEDYADELEARLEDDEGATPMVAEVVAMPSIDRDRFLADLCRECALLGIEWPASPKDETQRITKERQ